MSKHWGDIPTLPETDSGIAAIEREQMTKPRPMEVEGPPLHQPSTSHQPPSDDPLPQESFQLDPLTLHTIQLLQHSRKLRSLINAVQQQQENLKNGDESEILSSFPPAPPLPEFNGSNFKHQVKGPLPYLPHDPNRSSDFVRGIGKAPPELSSATNRKLLKRSVAAICAHSGFDTCGESVLDTMTDVVHEYLLKMTSLLRSAVDNEALHGATGFQDTMEQVFHEVGLGSMTSLHRYYQTRIVTYHEHMQQASQQLMDEYEKVMNPENFRTDDFKTIKVKDEPLSDIQFPTTDDAEELLDPDALMQLEGLTGFDMGSVQETASLVTEEENKWTQNVKPEPQEGKLVSLEQYDAEEAGGNRSPSVASNLGSEAGDSVQASPSISNTDIMSPPTIAGGKPPPKKKKRR